ncbi:phosphoribosylanthranilate isomerase [Prevotella jejuni]|jgi:phosphoribosylanthranilate isomerase|uniref:phosphoribosylanthranilate isomerase n=1 Tax=Prevotella jejuni TaxID=1177574 RepID=UPI001BA87E14|nr:phosphoribosylanthranilate isomerase [Prevotella jejuni]QUB80842.1 phosphoribosylanthranilate isomerase [Prevotella jejuni]
MIIKVCGMRDARNIHEVSQLGIDWIGLDFIPNSERYVSQIASCAGIIPDYSSLSDLSSDKLSQQKEGPVLCGVFTDDMPQNIVTRVVNFDLDVVQLNGDESSVMIDNLRRTLDPDIHAGIKIMKRLVITKREDIENYKEYAEGVDYFLFDVQDNLKDWSILEAYDGKVPFLVSGNIGAEDIENIKTLSHPLFYGISVNEKFESAPAVKDIALLKDFLEKIK